MIVELQQNPQTLKTLIKDMRDASGEKHPVISGSDVNLYLFYGAVICVKYAGLTPVSVNMTKIGKRKKNIWEPYANWYGAYTLPSHRRQGHATELYRHVEGLAVSAGCRRIKSLAGSGAGLALHKSLNHDCWGLTPNHEVWVDSALPGSEQHYAEGSVPPQAPASKKMTPAQMVQLIVNQELRYDRKA
jgi:GNAT superfamily N-acetyltransferase